MTDPENAVFLLFVSLEATSIYREESSGSIRSCSVLFAQVTRSADLANQMGSSGQDEGNYKQEQRTLTHARGMGPLSLS